MKDQIILYTYIQSNDGRVVRVVKVPTWLVDTHICIPRTEYCDYLQHTHTHETILLIIWNFFRENYQHKEKTKPN